MPGEHIISTQGICVAIRKFADALATHRRTIDQLNVYPVPDGDTGTNLSLTLNFVCEALDELSPDQLPDRVVVCETISKSVLMGARGNSGVIMSQFLRAMVGELAPVPAEPAPDEIAGAHLAASLQAGSVAADASVQKPVEGTILSVARAAAQQATKTAAQQATQAAAPASPVLRAARQAGQVALERTPEQLPILAETGVVDAGAVGFLLWLDALLAVVDDQQMPAELDLPSYVVDTLAQSTSPPDPTVQSGSPSSAARPGSPSSTAQPSSSSSTAASAGTRYEVMFLLDCEDDQIDQFRQTWSTLGDSIVVAGGDGFWNCHIHTDEIGASIEAGITVGRPHRIAITDLHEQVEQLGHAHIEPEHVRSATGSTATDPSTSTPASASTAATTDASSAATNTGAANSRTPAPTCAVIAVSPAAGVDEIFQDLGATGIVGGGQTMNPSTAEIFAAIQALDANAPNTSAPNTSAPNTSAPGTSEVILLPNNSNIVAAAELAAEQANTAQTSAAQANTTTRQIRVVPTHSIPHGISAMLAFDPDQDSATNAAQMTEMANGVIAGEVTQAVRPTTAHLPPAPPAASTTQPATQPTTQINAGDWIGISSGISHEVKGRIVSVADNPAQAAIDLLAQLIQPHHSALTVVTGEVATPAHTQDIQAWLTEEHTEIEVDILAGGQPHYPYLLGLE